MDTFLGNIHTLLFRKWIIGQTYENMTISEKDIETIIIETKTCHSEINFHEMDIIELIVTNKTTGNNEFYIHFQMNNLHHAIGLFNEMIECIQNTMSKTNKKVLLSCSSGFTTSMFAEKLNEVASILELNYEFNAVGFMDLFEQGNDYDIILLAPQISYQHAKTQQHLKKQTVLNIPPQIFAKYDANALLQFLQTNENNKDNTSQTKALNEQENLTHDKTLTVIMSRPTPPQINLSYKLVENGKLISENTITKLHINVTDMVSIIDVLFIQHPDIKKVGISLPGIINNGISTYTSGPFNDTDILGPLKKKYAQVDFTLVNDVNAAAMGYYASQNKYKSLSVLSQSHFLKAGGVGHIVNGECLLGRKNMAGEVQFMPMNLSEYPRNLDGMLHFVSIYCLFITTMVAPESIVVCCPYILDNDDIVNAMSTYLPTDLIPEIILVDDLSEYMHIGLLNLCIKKS